jgi:hypothetical protein
MKNITAAVLCLSLMTSSTVGAADKPMIAVYPTLLGSAVVNFDQGTFDLQEFTRRVEEALRATRKFRVYERSAAVLKKWALEGDIAESGLARERATEFAKLNNVHLIVQPIVVEFQLDSDFKSVDGLAGTYRRTDGGRLSVTSKVLSTTTGEVKYQITIDDEFQREPKLVQGKVSGIHSRDWTDLALSVGVASASSIVNAVFPMQVLHYQSSMLFLNRGEGGGIKVGDELQLFSVGDDMIDPVTKENLGPVEIPIGMVRIVQIKPKTSTAIPIGDLVIPPKPGDIARH